MTKDTYIGRGRGTSSADSNQQTTILMDAKEVQLKDIVIFKILIQYIPATSAMRKQVRPKGMKWSE